MAKGVTVYEVLADTAGEGACGDGTVVFRFRKKAEADAFAAKSTCYGRPTKATVTVAPRHVAQRWGMA